jgi:hypothetical protein
MRPPSDAPGSSSYTAWAVLVATQLVNSDQSLRNNAAVAVAGRRQRPRAELAVVDPGRDRATRTCWNQEITPPAAVRFGLTTHWEVYRPCNSGGSAT